MGWAKKIAKGFIFGVLTGTVFYVVGGMAEPYIPGVTATVTSVIGFTSAFAIGIFPEDNKK